MDLLLRKARVLGLVVKRELKVAQFLVFGHSRLEELPEYLALLRWAVQLEVTVAVLIVNYDQLLEANGADCVQEACQTLDAAVDEGEALEPARSPPKARRPIDCDLALFLIRVRKREGVGLHDPLR